jgi:hypothetical protein
MQAEIGAADRIGPVAFARNSCLQSVLATLSPARNSCSLKLAAGAWISQAQVLAGRRGSVLKSLRAAGGGGTMRRRRRSVWWAAGMVVITAAILMREQLAPYLPAPLNEALHRKSLLKSGKSFSADGSVRR